MTKVAIIIPSVLITPEGLDHVLKLGLDMYQTREERVSARGALMDAAGLCDMMADEIVAQNRKGRRSPTKLVLQVAAAFRECGDQIMRMRDRVNVPS